jgi:hypothetical protein
MISPHVLGLLSDISVDRVLSPSRREKLAIGFPVLNNLVQSCADWKGQLPEGFVPLLKILIEKASIPMDSTDVSFISVCQIIVRPISLLPSIPFMLKG